MDRRRNVTRTHHVTIKLMLLRNKEIRVDHHAFNVKDIACDLYSRRMELKIIGGTTICIAPNEMLISTYRRKTHYSVRFLGGSSRRMNNEKCGEPGIPEIEYQVIFENGVSSRLIIL